MFILFVLLFSASLSYAAIPEIIGYEGRLTDQFGTPISSPTQFTFKIWDDATAAGAGHTKSTSVETITPDSNGVFSTVIDVPDDVFDGTDRWLGVTIGTDTEMTPRIRVASAPYAYKALNGGGGGPINATDVIYDNAIYTNVALALDHLLYVSPGVSMTTSVGNQEIGTTITSTPLNWSISLGSGISVESQSIDQGIGSLTPSLRTYTDTASYTTNRTYTLTVHFGNGETKTANASIGFYWSRYYGMNSSSTLNDSQINALTPALATGRTNSFTLSPSGQYIYVCYPAAWGAASFTVNGLLNTDWTGVTQTHVNAAGGSTSYYVYRTNSLLTGTYIIGVL